MKHFQSQPQVDSGSVRMRRKKDKQFHFKQFSVRHDRSGMKVGTDGTLLGAWVNVSGANRILDIGTGTGLIALMLAQRTSLNVMIEAIEIDAHACEDAAENFAASLWSDRIILHRKPLQEFSTTGKFDLMVSNPPFFQNSFKPPTQKRTTARHTESLSFHELLISTQILLAESGKLNVILPPTEGGQFITLAESFGFFPSRHWTFRTKQEKPVERLLLEFSRNQLVPEVHEILLYSSNEDWTAAYQSLTRDFYLKL